MTFIKRCQATDYCTAPGGDEELSGRYLLYTHDYQTDNQERSGQYLARPVPGHTPDRTAVPDPYTVGTGKR